ncbi:hypothetical protein FIBSPDRAFT_97719 [Athelia psychrophila]|uniref:Uncharacterized protein n=1 Tax=Athelia psychrophila TaxID=1759441 RepID=A0A166DPT5_9AGAM|nr:hypothetical protein FIBSPDRAFT_97719 [Fibularhizoctonia sp. CBS 109695]
MTILLLQRAFVAIITNHTEGASLGDVDMFVCLGTSIRRSLSPLLFRCYTPRTLVHVSSFCLLCHFLSPVTHRGHIISFSSLFILYILKVSTLLCLSVFALKFQLVTSALPITIIYICTGRAMVSLITKMQSNRAAIAAHNIHG